MLRDYGSVVHRSVIKRELIFGVPILPLILVSFGMLIGVLALWQIWLLPIGVLLLVVMAAITSKDEWYLDILVDSLFLPNRLD